MSKKHILKIVLLAGISVLLLQTLQTGFALTVDPNYAPRNSAFNLNFSNLTASQATNLILQLLSGTLLYFAAPVAVIMIIWAGADMVLAAGETEKIDQAKKHLTWAILGLLLIILSASVVRAILTFVFQSATPAPSVGIIDLLV